MDETLRSWDGFRSSGHDLGSTPLILPHFSPEFE
jgi:hypothetical protein